MLTARQNARRARQDQLAKLAKLKAIAREIVAIGRCPECGRPIRRNLALAGWWQCQQFGAAGFRADSTLPACDWQTFTE